MKKLLLLILPFLFLSAKAQITFPAPGATWHYLLGGTNNVTKYERDSIYQGKQTKVLTGASFFGASTCPGWHDIMLIYTSNDSIFVHGSKAVHNWELLYSFNTPVGQSWQLTVQFNSEIDTLNVRVDSVKNTTINSISLKTLYVTYTEHMGQYPNFSNYPYHSVIYDRIGDPKGLLNCTSYVAFTSGPCYAPILLCYSDSAIGTYQPDTSKSCTYTSNVGINQLSNNNPINIYPNPAQNKITIDANNIVEVKLFDILGNQIISNKENQLDVSNLVNGVYFLQVKTSTVTTTQKILVQH